MILLTEFSVRSAPPDFISNGAGVWRFSFAGDVTYIDDDGDTFFWGDRRTIVSVRGVAVGPTNYLETSSVANCAAAEESFFWDDANKRLYVHHEDDANDYAIDREKYRILTVSEGYATGTLPGQHSYFDTLYFDPIITSVGRLQKRVDPLKFGLLSFESSQFEIANADGDFDQMPLALALNSQVRFLLMESGDTALDDGTRVFTGYTAGADRDDERVSFTLSEARIFFNRRVCPNVFTTTAYASLDDRHAGKPIPVAYGDVRRGVAIPVDTASFDQAVGGTVTFVVADPALGAVRAIDALYDDNGNSVTLGTINLTNCTVQTSIAADADVDLSRFSWRGEGYDITGTYTNGLDIIKSAFAVQGDTPYLSDTYDTTQWAAQTALLTQAIGISAQSERGIIDELVEPITVSLQGVVDVLGDGRITFLPRDPDAEITETIEQDQIISGPTARIQTHEVVSSVVVQYGRSAVDDEDTLIAIYDDEAVEVAGAYGVETTQPISPVPSALTVEADAIALGAEIAATSTDPQRLYILRIKYDGTLVPLFGIVRVNVGRYGEETYIVAEVLERSLGLDGAMLTVEYEVREIGYRGGTRITDADDDRITDDGSRREVV